MRVNADNCESRKLPRVSNLGFIASQQPPTPPALVHRESISTVSLSVRLGGSAVRERLTAIRPTTSPLVRFGNSWRSQIGQLRVERSPRTACGGAVSPAEALSPRVSGRAGATTSFEAYFRWTEFCFLASDFPTPIPEALANAPPSPKAKR